LSQFFVINAPSSGNIWREKEYSQFIHGPDPDDGVVLIPKALSHPPLSKDQRMVGWKDNRCSLQYQVFL
jgi:hypothetical protein